MPKLITVAVFQYPQEAHIIQSKLKSEGITALLKDELTVQTDNFLSNAIGGVKLQIFEEDLERAIPFLEAADVFPKETETPSEVFEKIHNFTKNIPVFGKWPVELRMALLLMIPIILLLTLFFFITKT